MHTQNVHIYNVLVQLLLFPIVFVECSNPFPSFAVVSFDSLVCVPCGAMSPASSKIISGGEVVISPFDMELEQASLDFVMLWAPHTWTSRASPNASQRRVLDEFYESCGHWRHSAHACCLRSFAGVQIVAWLCRRATEMYYLHEAKISGTSHYKTCWEMAWLCLGAKLRSSTGVNWHWRPAQIHKGTVLVLT